MPIYPIFIFLGIFVFFAVLAALFWGRLRQVENAYQKALEGAQRKLDQQISRVNILTRTLPNLRSFLKDPNSTGAWTRLCVDEGRALVGAHEGVFWRFNEKKGRLEREFYSSEMSEEPDGPLSVALSEGEIGQVAVEKSPMVRSVAHPKRGEVSYILTPLVVGSRLWGVFRFSREGEPLFTQRDGALITMFLHHLSIAVENHELIRNREEFYLELVQTLADTLEARDSEAPGHTRHMRELARGTARELSLPGEFIHYLEFAALLHDIGKIGIADTILRKPGKLTDTEFEIIKKHPELGHKILSPVSLLAPVAPMVLYHQEWFNGKGYPEGLKGEEIPLGARIVALLDAWGAMTVDRPWRKAMSTDAAVSEIKKGAGTQFDPQVVEAFLTTLDKQGFLRSASSR